MLNYAHAPKVNYLYIMNNDFIGFVEKLSKQEKEILKAKLIWKRKNKKEEPKQDRTCTNNCSVVCGECQIFEPKQETLEEAAKDFIENTMKYSFNSLETKTFANRLLKSVEFGAKWQAERMYSEEDMIAFAEFVAEHPDKNRNHKGEMLHAKSKYDGAERTIDLLEDFKKK